jgi:hemolysin activation/secretion protein
VSFGIDSKDFKESARVGSDTTETPISYVQIAAEYRATVTAAPTRTHTGYLGFYTAPRSLFGNNPEEFARKRFGARPNYLYVRGEWVTEQRYGASLLRAKLAGQLSDQPLISNEQYASGGADTVRGYLEIERLADQGVLGSVEFKRALRPGGTGLLSGATVLAFADASHLWISRPLPGQKSELELYGAGVGVRWQKLPHWVAGLDVGVPLTDGQVTRKNEPRAHFRVEGKF